MRAAAAALSVAAYHEDNVDRMGRVAPDLIPVLVSLLPHPDPEVQAHAATALANLAHGSPSYQSEAGEAGAIAALLDVCRGRAGVDGNDDTNDADGDREGDRATVIPSVGMDTVVEMPGVSDNQIKRGGRGATGPPPGNSPRGKKRPENSVSQVEDQECEVLQGGDVNKDEEKRGENKETGDRTGENWAQTRDSEKEEATGTVVEVDGRATGTAATHPAKSKGTTGGQGENTKTRNYEGGEGLVMAPQPGGRVEDKGGEESGAAATMDVDAVQAATAALANLLCYSEANSVRLVAAGGIGVLVGLVSSYRPQNILDFDQVCRSTLAGGLGIVTELCLPRWVVDIQRHGPGEQACDHLAHCRLGRVVDVVYQFVEASLRDRHRVRTMGACV